MDKVFIEASRSKLRFTSGRGSLSVEDLWDLDLKDLDRIAVGIDEKIKESSGHRSFLTNPDRKLSKAIKEDELRLEVIKVIINTREAENSAKRLANENQRRLETLRGLRDQKRMEELASMPAAELDAQIAALEAGDGVVDTPAAPALAESDARA